MILGKGIDINTTIEYWLKNFTVFKDDVLSLYSQVDSNERLTGFSNKHMAINRIYFLSHILIIYLIDNADKFKELDTFLAENDLLEAIETLKCKGVDINRLLHLYEVELSDIVYGIESITHGVETSFEVEPTTLIDYITNLITELDLANTGVPDINIAELAEVGRLCIYNIQECLVPPFSFNNSSIVGECHNVCCAN